MKLSQLTITKSLRAEYKTTPPAHKVLANRIAERDPGNAPASGERIGYVYVQALAGQQASKLQGERVETPAWIMKHKLKPDAEYYINHQLYNPLAQLFGIMVEKMPGFVAPTTVAQGEKLVSQREALAGQLLFNEGLGACRNSAKKEFMKLFGVSGVPPVPVATSSTAAQPLTPRPVFRKPPVDETMAKAEAEAFGGGSKPKVVKQQTLLSAFYVDTACFRHSKMAAEMTAAKRARGKAATKATTASFTEDMPDMEAVAPVTEVSVPEPVAAQPLKKKSVKGKKDTA